MSRHITIDYYEHETTGLVVGVSDDLQGLFVAGRSVEEVDERVPQAVRSLQEARRELDAAKSSSIRRQAGFKRLSRQHQIELSAA